MRRSIFEKRNATRELAVRFVQESNLIEEIDVAQETICISFACEEATGHVGALLFLEDALTKDEYFTEEMMFHCHQLIIEEQNRLLDPASAIPSCNIGVFRSYDIESVHLYFEKYKKIPEKIHKLVREIWIVQLAHNHGVLRLADDPLNIVADFHREFEQIHPFVDGNGRIGRLMTWYLMRYFGMKPIVFTHHDKGHAYNHAFRTKEGMRAYFRNRYTS